MFAGASLSEGCYTFMFPLIHISGFFVLRVSHPHMKWIFHLFLIHFCSKGNVFQVVKCTNEPDNGHCLVF